MKKTTFITFLLLFFCLTLLKAQLANHNFGELLQKSIYFYEAQQCGELPDWNRVAWRGDACTSDGSTVGVDLNGGWFDAGDHVKFNFPHAYTVTTLAWSGLEYKDAFVATGQWDIFLKNVKWGTDYLLKCHTAPRELWGQVGNGGTDHSYWVPAEVVDLSYERVCYKIDAANGGTELAIETASAFAAVSMLFADSDPVYAATLLEHARQLYQFGDEVRKNYHESITDATTYYKSWSGYQDELVWGAIWLYKATGEISFLNKAKAEYELLSKEGQAGIYRSYGWTIAWDDKAYGCYLLMTQLTGEQKYADDLERFLNEWSVETEQDISVGPKFTPAGFPILSPIWAPNRYAANTAFLAMNYSDWSSDQATKAKYFGIAYKLMDYILGNNPQNMSYVIGYGNNPPQNPHHRTAHGSWSRSETIPAETRHVLYGALIGGHNSVDDYDFTDDRSKYMWTEVACDYNSLYTGVVAGLYNRYGGNPLTNFPAVEVPDNEFLNEVKLNGSSSTYTEVAIWSNNRSSFPARTPLLSSRYFINLTEGFNAGYSVSDYSITLRSQQAVTHSGLQVWNAAANEYYVEVAFTNGTDIFPGGQGEYRKEFQIRIALPPSAPASAWDPTNDFSYQGLTSTLVEFDNVPIYTDGVLAGGNEPGGGNTPTAKISATPKSGDAPLQVAFSGSQSTDPNGDALTYAWNFGDGTTGSGISVNHTYTAIGNVTATLTVSDGSNTNSAIVIISVTDPNDAPIAKISATPSNGIVPFTASFNAGESTDPNGDALTYSWDFGDGTIGTGVTANHTYTAVGSYTVTLTVSDGSLTDSETATIIGSDGSPIADFSATPSTGDMPLLVSFNASASTDPNGDAMTYTWSFGDGSNGTGITTTHTYVAAGNFTATLTVSDGSDSDSKSVAITVNDPNQTSDLKVLYKDGGNGSPLDNSIHPHLQLVNTGTEPVAYGDIKVRYYFTNEGMVNCNFFVDYAQVGSGNVNGSFAPISPAVAGADYYLDVTFAASLGNLADGANSGNIQARFAKNNWSNFNENDDFSYDVTSTSYTENQNIVVYVKGVKVWGNEPGTDGNRPPSAVISPSVLSGIAPLSVTFNGAGSSDPDGDAITFLWNSGETTSSISKTYTAAGTYNVTLIVSDGSLSDNASVSVVVTSAPVSVTGISVDPIGLNLTPGQTSTVVATVVPANATDKSVAWTSSNTAAATVNQSGVVTAVADGNAVITVTTNDGGFQATCNVLVETQIVHVTSVTVNPSSTSIVEGNSEQLAVTLLPSNATNKSVTWTSSNSAAATVSQSGLVTAVAEGSALITATSVDGNITDNCNVTVTSAGGCTFNVPQTSPLASLNKAYSNIHVIGNGPNLSNVTNFTINWDQPNNGLWQLSMNTNNGQPSWWNDLNPKATHSFGSANPAISLSGTGFPSLDGNYWITMDGTNLVWVEKTGAYTIYFSTSAADPCGNKSGSIAASTKKMVDGVIKMYPNPANDYVLISGISTVKEIYLMNILGQVESIDYANGLSEFNFDLSKYKTGIYLINFKLLDGELVQQKLIIK